MADVTNLEFTKSTYDTSSTTYSATKNDGKKTCTIFVNDRTNNGFGKDDYFYYKGDISLFSQTEIKNIIEKGAGGQKYVAANVATGKMDASGIRQVAKLDTCKELQEGEYYEVGSVFNCAAKAEEKTQAEAKAKAEAEAKAKAAADAKAAEAAKNAPPATPAAKDEKPIPPPPEQNYDQQYYQQQWAQQPPVSYGPSPAEMMGTSALAGGAIGGIIGFLFGGPKGFWGGAFGGALGGLMSFCGMGAMGFMGGGFGGYDDGGMASLDAELNGLFAYNYDRFAAIASQPTFIPPSQNEPAIPPSNLPKLTAANFDETIKNSKTPVIVEFAMDGSKPCQKQSATLEEVSKAYSGKVQVYQIDSVNDAAITQKYNVKNAPTIIVFKDGKEFKRLEKLQSKETITAALDDKSTKTTA